MSAPRLGLLGSFLLFVCCGAQSQTPATCNIDEPSLHIVSAANSTHSCALLRQAFALREAHKPAAAEQRFRETIESAKQPEDWAIEAYAHYGLGMCLSTDTHFDSATPELQQARSAFELHADSLGEGMVDRELGRISYVTSQRKQAIALYDQAIAEFQTAGDQHRELAVSLDKEFILPESQEKLTHLGELQATAEKLHDDMALGRCLHIAGDVLFSSGDYGAALAKYQEALTLTERSNNKEETAAVLISMGRLERAHGRPQAAFPYYRRALKIERELGRREAEIVVLNATATAYDSLNMHAQGMTLLRQALALARAEHLARYERFELGNLAGDYVQIGRCDRAIPLLKQSMAGEDSDYILGYRYQGLAHCLLTTHRLAEALQAANRAVDLRQHDNNQEAMLDSLLVRSQIRSQLGDRSGAINDTDQVLAKLEDVREHVAPNDYLKRGFLDYSKEYYDTAIMIHAQQGDFSHAAEIAEQGRARAFLDLLATRDSGDSAKTLTTSQSAGAGQADPRRIASDSTVSAQSFTAEQMIDAARRLNSTILTYWSGDDELLIFTVSPKGKIAGHRVSTGSDRLRTLVAQTRPGALKLGSGTESKQRAQPDVWNRLYALLIAPVEADLPRNSDALLTIVPHGALFEVPFEALRDTRSRYLVERYAIHYLPAVAVLEYTAKNREQALGHPPKNLLVAQSFAETHGKVQRLPATSAEIKKISLAVGQSVSLSDHELRAQQLEQEMSDATLVHLATHAIFDNASPMSSYLTVGHETNSGGDNRITASQIYDLHVPADLVVLSACETGRGKVTGDGVLGMTRAFFAAGSASVVASVWDVPDTPTEQLMVTFYRGLQRGLNKSEALRQAQLALIRRLRDKKVTVPTVAGTFTLPEDPQFWAGFVLEGNP